jgi:hypothetical protein
MSTRYCTIHRLLWNDDKFPHVSDDCQLVTLHVFTTNYMTNFGLSQTSFYALAEQKKWGPKGEKKIDIKRYEKAFQEGITEGFYEYDPEFQMLYIPNLKKYNPPQSPNVITAWGKTFNEFPDCTLKDKCFQQFKAFLEGYGEAFQEAYAKAFTKPSSKAPVPVPVLLIPNEAKKTAPLNGLQRFTEFWNLYPRKQNKGQAEKAWKKLDQETKDKILKILPSYIFSYDPQFQPMPASWLNGKRWEDESTSNALIDNECPKCRANQLNDQGVCPVCSIKEANKKWEAEKKKRKNGEE